MKPLKANTPKDRSISVAICGLGHWGKNYVRNFSDLSRSRVLWCCDISDANQNLIRSRYPHVQLTRNYADILGDPAVEAVVIATPAVSHYDMVRRALAAGKDVLVEKPLALKAAEAEKLIALAAKHRRILMVGHTFLYNEAVRKMKSIVDSGAIGDVYYIKAVRSHLGLIREDVNAVWDLATHDVSIFNYILSKTPVRAQAAGIRFLNPKREDAAFITLQYGKELLGHIHVSWADSNKQRLVEIIGSKGRVQFDDLNPLEPIRLFERGISTDRMTSNFGEYKYQLRDGDIISPNIKMQEPLRLQCEHFLDCVLSRRKPMTDGVHGLEVVKTMLLIDRALAVSRL